MTPAWKDGPLPVSVVVPCFNNSRLLPECIASINRGTRPDEIVIIDDASTDDSLNVARQLATNHDNIVVLARQMNGGAAAARRDGLQAARNEWVALVDADDFVDENAVANAYATAQRDMSDICIWDMWRFDAGKTWPNIHLQPSDFPKAGRLAVTETLGTWKIHPLGVSRKSLYVDAYQGFQESMINADELITRVVLSRAATISLCDSKYYYRVNPQSSTQSFTVRRLSALDSHLWLLRFIKDYPEVKPEVIATDAIAQAWYFMRNRHRSDSVRVMQCIREFLPQLADASRLRTWIWRYPRHLVAFVLMTIASRFGGSSGLGQKT